MSKSTIDALRKDTSAKPLIDSAYGHAVFDTTKGGFIVTGAGGTGVAMRKNGGDPVYMHFGAGGVGLGAGLENYKLIVLFENEDTYERFVDGAWTAGGASAQASAGRRWCLDSRQVRQRRCGLSRDRQGRDGASRRDGREVLAERQAQPGRRLNLIVVSTERAASANAARFFYWRSSWISSGAAPTVSKDGTSFSLKPTLLTYIHVAAGKLQRKKRPARSVRVEAMSFSAAGP